jgi:hypothetical protein
LTAIGPACYKTRRLSGRSHLARSLSCVLMEEACR